MTVCPVCGRKDGACSTTGQHLVLPPLDLTRPAPPALPDPEVLAEKVRRRAVREVRLRAWRETHPWG